MPRATCRCGQALDVAANGSERIVCPKCGAKIRVRLKSGSGSNIGPGPGDSGDGYIRFSCPCGRRLKVSALDRPSHGKCPDCGLVVPVPTTSRDPGLPESRTEELGIADRAVLDRWTRDHLARQGGSADSPTATPVAPMPAVAPPRSDRAEVGLRVCPKCGRPIHLGAEACRVCGTSVPRR